MNRKNLILIHRGRDYEADFLEIADKVHALDPAIFVLPVAAGLKAHIPADEWAHPTLTIALCRDFKLPVERGPVLRNRVIGKLEQLEILRAHKISTPPGERFIFGMTLDPIVYGDFVVLKPLDPLLTSCGYGVQVMRRERAMAVHPIEFPGDHPIRANKHGYMVQRYIETGTNTSSYRVEMFLGAPIFAFRAHSHLPAPGPDDPDEVIESFDCTQKQNRDLFFECQEDLMEIAADVAAAFPDIPLLGVDFVKDAVSGTPYVLEVNAGGNTWHFSSGMINASAEGEQVLISTMKNQFSAFDTAAAALVEKVHALAA